MNIAQISRIRPECCPPQLSYPLLRLLYLSVLVLLPLQLSAQTITIQSGSLPMCPGSGAPHSLHFSVIDPIRVPGYAYNWHVSTDGGRTFIPWTNNTATSVDFGFIWSNDRPLSVGNKVKCIATKGSGRITSNVLTVTLKTPSRPGAVMSSDTPTHLPLCTGRSVTFTIRSLRPEHELRGHEWYLNGDLAAQGTDHYTVADFDPSVHDIRYKGRASGGCISSAAVTALDPFHHDDLIVYTPPLDIGTDLPPDNIVCPGQSVTFSVESEGTFHRYQWRLDGTLVSQAPTYTTAALSPGSTLTMKAVVSSGCGRGRIVEETFATDLLDFRHRPEVAIRIYPGAEAVPPGGDVTFFAEIEQGGHRPEIRWQVNNRAHDRDTDHTVVPHIAPTDRVQATLRSSAACADATWVASNTSSVGQDEDLLNYMTTYRSREDRSRPYEAQREAGYAPESVAIYREYLSGQGETYQQVQRRSSPLGHHTVRNKGYDKYGRLRYADLPYTSPRDRSTYRARAHEEARAFYDPQRTTGIHARIVRDTRPMEELRYAPSLLRTGNEVETAPPGRDWAPAPSGGDEGHTLRQQQLYNSAGDSVIKWLIDEGGALLSIGNYLEGELYKEAHTDEEGRYSLRFTDRRGLVVLNRTRLAEQRVDTYRVYDALGRLRQVLPPMFIENIDN